ncbi:MAG TPA: FAD-linked oxidase C-terminal domain-containing protein [Caulobacteraceae bacterium]
MAPRLAKPELEALFGRLTEVFGERVTAAGLAREHHAQDEGYHRAGVPDLVAFPASTEEVAKAVALCDAARCPVIAWGAGTSLEGNGLASQGGLCLDLSRMTAVIGIQPQDLSATVQAGVRREQLNAELKGTGLYFPIDPGADATLGGMAATRASGTNAVKYGTMRANVLSCTVVMADGQVVRTARRAPKSAAGYDLTALMVGSEGTLGVITELTVRLYPLPEAVTALICPFESIEGAVQAVIAAIQLGLGAARLEFLDAAMMTAVNLYEKTAYAETPTLFVEFHGSPASVPGQVAAFEDFIGSFGGVVALRATLPEDRTALWTARHHALYAARALQPGASGVITDVCVPISRLADCLLETRADLDASSLTATVVGHVGDGNFHCLILVDPDDIAQVAEAEALHQAMARRAIGMDGTCTGEHGVGLGKRELLVEELGSAIPVMAAIKAALDPHDILNPGKILPSPAEEGRDP